MNSEPTAVELISNTHMKPDATEKRTTPGTATTQEQTARNGDGRQRHLNNTHDIDDESNNDHRVPLLPHLR